MAVHPEGALATALAGGAPAFAVAARRLNSDDRVSIEAAPLPASGTPGFGPGALVIVHGPGVDETRVAVAAGSLYGLSASEAAIAAPLAAGRSPAAIADERRVSLGTVRTRVRRIYEKIGVASQQLVSSQFLAENDAAGCISPMRLKDRLGQGRAQL